MALNITACRLRALGGRQVTNGRPSVSVSWLSPFRGNKSESMRRVHTRAKTKDVNIEGRTSSELAGYGASLPFLITFLLSPPRFCILSARSESCLAAEILPFAMRTRRVAYSSPSDGITFLIRAPQRKRPLPPDPTPLDRLHKQPKHRHTRKDSSGAFGFLPDDLLISIFVNLSSTADSPADLVNAMLTCKRFCAAATHPLVLSSAAVSALAVKASAWSDGAHRFLKRCAEIGNIEACYTLGMIRFYCLQNRVAGASLMAKAAMSSHAPALHSLAVIQFNGSGGSRKDKDLKAGVALCARAAYLGHVDAMRELGHCLQDGYGVPKNVTEGRSLLLEANAREAIASSPKVFMETLLQFAHSIGAGCRHHRLQFRTALTKLDVAQRAVKSDDTERQSIYHLLHGGGCSLLSDFGCNVPPAKLHIANQFLVEWFAKHPPSLGLRLCSHSNCGRPETRRHEYRRCSACGAVNYCSRACQALDWKLRHKFECRPAADWGGRDNNDVVEDGQVDFEDMNES